MKIQLAPRKIFSFGALILLCGLAVATHFATESPWLGLQLQPSPNGQSVTIHEVAAQGPSHGIVQPGQILRAIGTGSPDLPVTPADLIEEPDALASYQDYNAFIAKQERISQILSAPMVSLATDAEPSVEIPPSPSRPISDLPWLFWYQVVCGSIVFMAGIGVLAFRPRETVTFYYAMTGFGLMVASFCAAVYSTRELALTGSLLYSLSLINQFGSLLFSGFFVSILWYYPTRIHRFPLGPVVVAYYLTCWVLNFFQVFASLDAAMRLPMFLGLVLNLGLAIVQWRRSRNLPVQRAILKWFLLGWLSGTTLYVGLHTAPLMLGVEVVISQSMGWGILLTVYLGVALGITRYRLFNLDRWVLTGWYWFLGGALIIGLDALLVSQVDLSNSMALASAVGVAGWLYFPLRQMLWNRFDAHARWESNYHELLPQLLNTVLNTPAEALPGKWMQLIKQTFSPLHIEPAHSSTQKVEIAAEGGELILPAFNNISGLKLSYANHGSRLFNAADCRLANSLLQLFSHLQSFRGAFQEGVQQERRRVARDLHDDVGAKLLTLVYSAKDPAQAGLARETLQELRDVIRDLERSQYTLQSTLTELELETERRCQAHSVGLHWSVPKPMHDHVLASRQHSNIQRIVREAITNALRHTDTDELRIDIQQENNTSMTVSVRNRLPAGFSASLKAGRGMLNIQSRAVELGGTAKWDIQNNAAGSSCTLTLQFPLGETT